MRRGCVLVRGVVGLLVVVCVAVGAMPALADDASEAQELVEKARLTIERFTTDPAMTGFRDAVKHAKGVFISPQVLRSAFIVGVSGGSGVLLAREQEGGPWGGPAFYSVAHPSKLGLENE